MLLDRYGQQVSTPSAAARDHYVLAVDRFLAGQAGVVEAFQAAIDADEGFALAYIGLAREYQIRGDRARLAAPLAKARALVAGGTQREAGQVRALGLLLDGKAVEAQAAVRAHLAAFPRDAMVAQTCTGVFGLIGFSGKAGREAEQLAFTSALLPHYGDDWWFLSQHAFAQLEVEQYDAAEVNLDLSLGANPDSAHGAHIRAHLYYETGDADSGLAYLDQWRQSYARGGILHCHVSWHVALWALAAGDTGTMWSVVDADIDPATGAGPPLNVLTDMVAILFRAELAGVPVPVQKWRDLSRFARVHFPKPGLAFADTHAAIAHAMAGDSDGAERIMLEASGPAGPVVAQLARAFAAMARQDWDLAMRHLQEALPDQARIGGSRAQRDLLFLTFAACLSRSGRREEAARFLALSRPHSDVRLVA